MLLRVPGSYGTPDPIFPTVIVDDGTVPTPVKVVMGVKAGRLVLTILDGDTDRVIESGSIRFSPPDHPEWPFLVSTSFPKGKYEVLTPSTPFTIKFETWHGEWVARNAFDSATGLPLEVVQLDLGSRKEITVRLK
jgi:hypothetical protein